MSSALEKRAFFQRIDGDSITSGVKQCQAGRAGYLPRVVEQEKWT
jgi:hypothetical protein